jgi:hypothetical protein
MKVLSRLQFVVAGLVHESNLFTPEDLAHLSNCVFSLDPTTRGENALIAGVIVEFRNWSYLDHREARHDADRMPAEVRVVFLQDEDRKLTGAVECGFFAEDPVLTKQLDYIRGW